MSNGPETADTSERRAPTLPCTSCGVKVSPIALLDSRQGKVFRLFRCK
jgi:hypothetical protein